MQDLDEITEVIVDVALRIHRDLGPGFLESVYETILASELERRALCVERQKVIQFEYQGIFLNRDFAWISLWTIESSWK